MKRDVVMLMSLMLASFLFISGACTGNFNPQVSGGGDPVKQERTVSGFDALEVGGAFEIFLTQGPKESLTIEADSDIIDMIVTEVRGNTLKIYTEKGCCKNVRKMAVYLTMTDVERIDISGACELENTGSLKLDNLEMEVSGASEMSLKMDVDKLELNLSGASELFLEGSCSQLYLDASGASEIEADQFLVGKMTIDASGASDCRVYVTDELVIEASGATTVRYAGNPKVTTSTSGASTVKPI